MPLREFLSACHTLRFVAPACRATQRLNSLCPASETQLSRILQHLCDFKNSLAPDRHPRLQDQDACMFACAFCAGSPTRKRDYASERSIRTASRCKDMLAPDRKCPHWGPLSALAPARKYQHWGLMSEIRPLAVLCFGSFVDCAVLGLMVFVVVLVLVVL